MEIENRKVRNTTVDPKQIVDALVASEDTVKLLLAGIQTYAPDFMHGLAKEDYVQEAEEAIAALREAAVVLARVNRAATPRKTAGRPPVSIPGVIVKPQGRPFMSMEEVVEMFGISKSTIYTRMRSGDFPLPIKTGQRGVRWRADELMTWSKTLPHAEYGDCE